MNPEEKPIPYVRRNTIAACVTILVIAPMLWMLMDRQPPFTDHVGRIIPDDPSPGDFIFVEWKMKVHRVCKGWVQREVVDSQGVICNYDRQPAIRQDQLYSYSREDAPNMLNRGFSLCTQATPGPARYRALTCYECNPLQHWWPICVRTPDINFTIKEKP